ncbi:uncharacterized protein LOC142334571 isoform X2 [Convolutriloba macropyga]|uniref:uncharacterized protein LOC142334571 isoform X2 n=1 Tax=Convolutriloba macropyga TaxID=536237 RepID=UPI003F520B5C
MGVKFKGHSEYQSTYKWKDSLKSASYQPPEEVLAQEAGKPTYHLAYTLNEPPLQHKRRIADPYVTDQLLETTNPREIAELLQQSPTDADNKAKAKMASKIQQPAGSKTKFASPNTHTKAGQNLSKTYQVKSHPRREEQKLSTKSYSKTEKTFSPPKAPRFEKDSIPVVEYPHPNPDPYSDERLPEQLKLGLTDGLIQNQSKQPEQEKRFLASAMVPKLRPRVSEYKRQFPKWENFPRPKPTLDDSEIVFKSHSGIPPYATDYIRRSSEYQKEFKDWSASLAKGRNLAARPKRGTTMKAIDDIGVGVKSKGGRRHGEGEEGQFVDTRLTQPSMEKIPPQVPHFPMRKHRSEYSASFKDASRDDQYTKTQTISRSLDEEKAAVAGSTSFTNEVGDLRQKAAYYGARHLGTHISRDHLGQLVARNADRWDDPGSPNSDLRAEDGRGLASALDLAKARGGKRVGVAPKNKTAYSVSDRPAGLPSKLQFWDFDPSRSGIIPAKTYTVDKEPEETEPVVLEEEYEDYGAGKQDHIIQEPEKVQVFDLEDDTSLKRQEPLAVTRKPPLPTSSVVKTVPKPKEEKDLIPSSSRSSHEKSPSQRFGLRNTLELGRVPTPEMGETVNKASSFYPKSRHHLDRTTVIKPDSARLEKKASLTQSKARPRPNSARPVVKSSEEHFGNSQQMPSRKMVQAEFQRKKDKSGKSVYPVAKIDSWIVRSPRDANTQYTRSPIKSFGRPTGDTHELILNSSSGNQSPVVRESPQPFTTTVLEKQLSEQANKVKDARDYQDAAFDARFHSENDESVLRLPLDSLKQNNVYDDDLEKVSLTSLASSRSMASEILDRARNRRDRLRLK